MKVLSGSERSCLLAHTWYIVGAGQHFYDVHREMFVRWNKSIAGAAAAAAVDVAVGFAFVRILLFFILHACPYTLPSINYYPFVQKIESSLWMIVYWICNKVKKRREREKIAL